MKNSQTMKHQVLAIFLFVSLAADLTAQSLLPAPNGIDISSINRTVKPCDDFYEYANGNWLARASIPSDRPFYGIISALEDHNREVLHHILEQAAETKSSPGSIERKVGDFYRSGMDTARLEMEGAKPLVPEFARISAIKNLAALQAEMARLHRFGINAAFNFSVAQDAKNSLRQLSQIKQGGLGLPDKKFYLNEDAQTRAIRLEYAAHIARIFELLGDEPTEAAANSKVVLDLETNLAEGSMTREAQRDPNAVYHILNFRELQTLTKNFRWNLYFVQIGLKSPTEINVGQFEFFKNFDRLLASVSLNDWKIYLRWKLIDATTGKLSSSFANEDFRFNGATLYGAKEPEPRWKQVLQTTDAVIGEALGQLYIERNFNAEAKRRALAVVENVKKSLAERLAEIDWIGDETRRRALEKLAAINVKIGYPDHWRDYSALPVNQKSYVLNFLQARKFEFDRNLRTAGKPVDRAEWKYSPPTVDAYYNPNLNEIVFPAGILQPPYFDPNAEDAENYGSIGVVIGHELTHGFDDGGRRFDADGNLKNWWTERDERNFQERAELIERQFDEFIAIDQIHINGRLTLNENIADLGGVKIAFSAFQKTLSNKSGAALPNGYSPEQRFFLAYAQIWRAIARPEIARIFAITDTHALPRFRVNAPLANLPEFSQAFGCQPNETEARPENLRVKIW